MKIDFLIQTWERIIVTGTAEQKLEVVATIREGLVTTSNDLIEYLDEQGIEYDFQGTMAELDTPVSVEANGGCSTLDVTGEDGIELYKNGN